ncbi:MAG: DUF6488 family protein [Gammaproteobacteria bacterium]|nr:DUF6488 family protein [Gammaproteobacteria bacterium]
MNQHTKAILLISMLLIGFNSPQSYAGPGHDGHAHSHDVDANTAKKNAAKVVNKLVEKKKISDTWGSTQATTVEKKRFGKQDEWVVTFKNPKEQDSSKQTLYVFLNMEGKYLAANFTGQ